MGDRTVSLTGLGTSHPTHTGGQHKARGNGPLPPGQPEVLCLECLLPPVGQE